MVGLALGWEPTGGVAACGRRLADRAWAIAAFAALGLLMAGTLRAEATLAAANLIYVVLLVAGAVVVPLSSYPDSLQACRGTALRSLGRRTA